MPVNTRKIPGRRKLRFESYGDLLADVERLAGGPVEQLGNWNLAQVAQHLGKTMHGSIDGLPLRPNWLIRVFGKLLLRRSFLEGPMPAGFQLPASAAALLPDDKGQAAAIADLRAAIERVQTVTERVPHAILGEITLADWDRVHLRHAELHLSFLRPANGAAS